jgi:AraC-like DNA-binding protein
MATLIEATGIDAVREALSSTYGIRRLAAPSGNPYVRIEQEQLGQVGLHHLTFTMECDISGPPMAACYFGQLASGNIRYSRDGGGWESPTYGPGDVFLALPPGIPWHGDIVSADLELASLGLGILGQVASTAPGRHPEPIRFTGYQPATPRDARLWLGTFRFVRDQVLTTPAAGHPLVAGAAARLLASAALAAFPNNALTDPTIEDRHDAHPPTLRRAITFIDENAHQDISVADIATAAFVTTRALRLAFQRHKGMTPMEYLRQVRLDRAHQDLLAGDPAHDTVTAVACRWGFPSPSRFAALYRRAYGVPPGLTLRQD